MSMKALVALASHDQLDNHLRNSKSLRQRYKLEQHPALLRRNTTVTI